MKTVIVKQLNTEKTHKIIDGGVYTFLVSRLARKDEIKSNIETFFGVKVDEVKTVNLPLKVRGFRNRIGAISQYKKAYVKVARGMKIEFDDNVKE